MTSTPHRAGPHRTSAPSPAVARRPDQRGPVSNPIVGADGRQPGPRHSTVRVLLICFGVALIWMSMLVGLMWLGFSNDGPASP